MIVKIFFVNRLSFILISNQLQLVNFEQFIWEEKLRPKLGFAFKDQLLPLLNLKNFSFNFFDFLFLQSLQFKFFLFGQSLARLRGGNFRSLSSLLV